MIELIKSKLKVRFPNAQIDLVDNTEQHLGHKSSTGMHIAVRIKWDGFDGISLIGQHRMVQDCLRHELKGAIHALEIKTGIPQ